MYRYVYLLTAGTYGSAEWAAVVDQQSMQTTTEDVAKPRRG